MRTDLEAAHRDLLKSSQVFRVPEVGVSHRTLLLEAALRELRVHLINALADLEDFKARGASAPDAGAVDLGGVTVSPGGAVEWSNRVRCPDCGAGPGAFHAPRCPSIIPPGEETPSLEARVEQIEARVAEVEARELDLRQRWTRFSAASGKEDKNEGGTL